MFLFMSLVFFFFGIYLMLPDVELHAPREGYQPKPYPGSKEIKPPKGNTMDQRPIQFATRPIHIEQIIYRELAVGSVQRFEQDGESFYTLRLFKDYFGKDIIHTTSPGEEWCGHFVLYASQHRETLDQAIDDVFAKMHSDLLGM